MSLRDDARPPHLLEATFVAGVERAINAALRADPATQQRLARHSGRLIAVHLTLPPLTTFVLVVEDGLELYHASDADPDVRLTGSPLDLAAQLFDWDKAPALIGGPVRIEGDRELLQDLVAIARELDMDWGALMEPVTGSELAQQIDYGARRVFGWARETFSRLGNQLGDYLRDESRLVALRRDVYEFNQDVDELRMDLDRLGARVARLKTRLEPGDGDADA
jgi:ubiquinone biosynthesis protein UbiJ